MGCRAKAAGGWGCHIWDGDRGIGIAAAWVLYSSVVWLALVARGYRNRTRARSVLRTYGVRETPAGFMFKMSRDIFVVVSAIFNNKYVQYIPRSKVFSATVTRV